jgi:hypothetical protein
LISVYYKFNFSEDIPLQRVRNLFCLALIAVDAIHGRSAVRLDLSCKLDAKDHSLMVEAESDVGYDLSRVLVRLFEREFGGYFDVEKMESRRKNSDYVYSLGTLL